MGLHDAPVLVLMANPGSLSADGIRWRHAGCRPEDASRRWVGGVPL